jgi:ssDNA-binding Zn-finger/Zn-ribbon topoisomerase 1
VQGMYYCDSHKNEYEKHVGYNRGSLAGSTGFGKDKGTDRDKHKALTVQPKMEYCPSCGSKKMKKEILLGKNGYMCNNEPCKLSFEIEAIESAAGTN